MPFAVLLLLCTTYKLVSGYGWDILVSREYASKSKRYQVVNMRVFGFNNEEVNKFFLDPEYAWDLENDMSSTNALEGIDGVVSSAADIYDGCMRNSAAGLETQCVPVCEVLEQSRSDQVVLNSSRAYRKYGMEVPTDSEPNAITSHYFDLYEAYQARNNYRKSRELFTLARRNRSDASSTLSNLAAASASTSRNTVPKRSWSNLFFGCIRKSSTKPLAGARQSKRNVDSAYDDFSSDSLMHAAELDEVASEVLQGLLDDAMDLCLNSHDSNCDLRLGGTDMDLAYHLAILVPRDDPYSVMGYVNYRFASVAGSDFDDLDSYYGGDSARWALVMSSVALRGSNGDYLTYLLEWIETFAVQYSASVSFYLQEVFSTDKSSTDNLEEVMLMFDDRGYQQHDDSSLLSQIRFRPRDSIGYFLLEKVLSSAGLDDEYGKTDLYAEQPPVVMNDYSNLITNTNLAPVRVKKESSQTLFN